MKYFAKIEKEKNIYIVSFPDLPNINTYGDTIKEAKKNAEEALNGAIESDFERGFSIPEPTKYKSKGYYPIKLDLHIELALQLRKLRGNRTQSEIAKMLGISYQAYQKLENPRKCNPTLKTLEKIAKTFERELELNIG